MYVESIRCAWGVYEGCMWRLTGVRKGCMWGVEGSIRGEWGYEGCTGGVSISGCVLSCTTKKRPVTDSTFYVQIDVLKKVQASDPEGNFHCIKMQTWFDYRGRQLQVE